MEYPLFNRTYIFKGSMFHCYVRSPECKCYSFVLLRDLFFLHLSKLCCPLWILVCEKTLPFNKRRIREPFERLQKGSHIWEEWLIFHPPNSWNLGAILEESLTCSTIFGQKKLSFGPLPNQVAFVLSHLHPPTQRNATVRSSSAQMLRGNLPTLH